MTLEMAVRIAMRELGTTEEEINMRLAYAKGMAPGAGSSTLKEGKERQCIDSFKTLFQMKDENSEKFETALAVVFFDIHGQPQNN